MVGKTVLYRVCFAIVDNELDHENMKRLRQTLFFHIVQIKKQTEMKVHETVLCHHTCTQSFFFHIVQKIMFLKQR